MYQNSYKKKLNQLPQSPFLVIHAWSLIRYQSPLNTFITGPIPSQIIGRLVTTVGLVGVDFFSRMPFRMSTI